MTDRRWTLEILAREWPRRRCVLFGIGVGAVYAILQLAVQEGGRTAPAGGVLIPLIKVSASASPPHQAMIVALLPAGFEIENPRLDQAGDERGAASRHGHEDAWPRHRSR